MEEFKPNSYKYKKEHADEVRDKKLEKVVKGPVKVKKRTEISKFKDVFISEDVSNVKSYVLMDVLVPAIKKAISDIVTNGIDMVLYGETGRTKKNTISGSVSYRNYYDKKDDVRRSEARPYLGCMAKEVIIDSRGEAEEVLIRMDELIDMYGSVSVADYCEFVGIDFNYTDNNYGWTNIRSADIRRVTGGGYTIKLPKAMPINK